MLSVVARMAQILVSIGVSAALLIAGCEASQPSTSSESEIELRAGDDGPSAWIVAEGEAIAEAMVADPGFGELIGVAAMVMGDLRAAQQELTDQDLDSTVRTINEPWFAETMAPGTLLGYLGGNPADLARMRSLIEQLRVEHGLVDASPEDVGYVFELALADDEAQGMMQAAIAAELDLGPDWGQCEATCFAIYMSGLSIALTFFLVAMVIAALTFPFGLVLAAIAIAVFSRTLADLQAVLASCLAECDGIVIDPDLDLCGDDVCNQDEYCWTGILGVGADECRPKQGEGKTCSSHESCTSGCCKYYFPWNPVSKVCRPASKCS